MVYEILKYIDCFGTTFNFYTEKNRKFYTPLGGIFSLLALFFSVLIFIFLNIDDFWHTSAISSTSVIREDYSDIKFGEEKIWIPWRVRDYNNRKINHTDLFYPIIYYYKGIKNETNQGMELSYETINYKLCNETSMVNKSDLYMINISLDNLYCIDMEDIKMGGNWQTNFINYIEFDLYICKNGIEYDEYNKDCSSYDKIIKAAENNSFEMEVFYPEVNYQPNNKTTPIFVKYSSYFYHLSRYSNKIDRLYLQKYILSDDDGWLGKSITNYTYWGCSSIKGDSYTTGDKNDLMNEGSSSRLYSFNIYLNSDIINYNRSYKKVFIIITDRLPIINVVYIIFSIIAKLFKVSSGNKKLTELLFENLKEKPNKSIKNINGPITTLKMKAKSNHQSIKKFNSINKNSSNNYIFQSNDISNVNNNKNNFINSTNNNINDVSSSYIHLSPQHNARKKINIIEKRRFSVNSQRANFIFYRKTKNNNNNTNLSNILSNSSFNNNINLNYGTVGVNNNNINININNNLRNYESNKSEDFSSKIYITKKKINLDAKNIYKKKISIKPKKKFIKVKLFPYKYYFCSIFIKNFNTNKKPFFFTKKFINVYNFICQLFDISSYLILQKEFQMIKNTLGKGKLRTLIENKPKINVNDNSFYNDMKECLDYNKFSILGKNKNTNDKRF